MCVPPNVCVHLCEGAFLSSRGRGGSGGVPRHRQEASLPAAPGLQPCLSPLHLQAVTEVLQRCIVYQNEAEAQLLQKLPTTVKLNLHWNIAYKNIKSRSFQTDLVCNISYFWMISKNVTQAKLATMARRGCSGDILWWEGRLLVWWGAGVWGGVGEEIWSRSQCEE